MSANTPRDVLRAELRARIAQLDAQNECDRQAEHLLTLQRTWDAPHDRAAGNRRRGRRPR